MLYWAFVGLAWVAVRAPLRSRGLCRASAKRARTLETVHRRGTRLRPFRRSEDCPYRHILLHHCRFIRGECHHWRSSRSGSQLRRLRANLCPVAQAHSCQSEVVGFSACGSGCELWFAAQSPTRLFVFHTVSYCITITVNIPCRNICPIGYNFRHEEKMRTENKGKYLPMRNLILRTLAAGGILSVALVVRRL